MSACISRDPFARTELHRQITLDASGGCTWCGNVRRTNTGRPYLYVYNQVSDGGRVSHIPGHFCSIDCMRSYNT